MLPEILIVLELPIKIILIQIWFKFLAIALLKIWNYIEIDADTKDPTELFELLVDTASLQDVLPL